MGDIKITKTAKASTIRELQRNGYFTFFCNMNDLGNDPLERQAYIRAQFEHQLQKYFSGNRPWLVDRTKESGEGN